MAGLVPARCGSQQQRNSPAERGIQRPRMSRPGQRPDRNEQQHHRAVADPVACARPAGRSASRDGRSASGGRQIVEQHGEVRPRARCQRLRQALIELVDVQVGAAPKVVAPPQLQVHAASSMRTRRCTRPTASTWHRVSGLRWKQDSPTSGSGCASELSSVRIAGKGTRRTAGNDAGRISSRKPQVVSAACARSTFASAGAGV